MHPHALVSRARQHSWDIQSLHPPANLVIILRRDSWRLEVTFADHAPQDATISGPGFEDSASVNLRSINALVRCDPGQIGGLAEAAVAGGSPVHGRAGARGGKTLVADRSL
ncbi:hypothetical protein [Nonomuraea zeae]|uniref:Uncharacterized protein n=1 Tax=Nonomuraea zeae TaxID=1642303 RepID=A0A5S4GG97_9ACTN|nr:hypothetical protein [Nonomuraea zeae]TMR31985.1 hypothetical protein ETD85_24045 [Nonomuraea zeae]